MIEVPEDLTTEMLKNMTHDELKGVSLEVFEDLLDDVVLGLCFEVHRAVKIGMLFLDESQDDEKYEIVDEIGLDVFGQVPLKKQFECVCPNCQRNLAASRFAPHLEKCMGMGRNSSRLASKRIANSGKTESDIEDYDNDSDWNYNPDSKKSSKKRKDKNSPRRSTKTKTKNGEGINAGTTSDGNVFANYETMSIDEKKALLMQMCGVISEHTKKMCTRSHRCPQHTDAQRKSVRVLLLGQQGNSLPDTSDDVQVDIDTYDEGDSQALRESMTRLWDPANSGDPSPADSTSTNNSTTSSKKKKEKTATGPTNRNSSGNKKGKSRPLHGSASSASSVSSSGQGSVEIA